MNNPSCFATLKNGESIDFWTVPVLTVERLSSWMLDTLQSPSMRILAFFATPCEPRNEGFDFRLVAVLGDCDTHTICVSSAPVEYAYPSLTPQIPALHRFEREIAEQFGIVPQGHPWLKPVRFHKSYQPGHDAWSRTDDADIIPCVTDFFELTGDAAHEVAVGPVHAGVIEPGHFRFQCLGEDVHHLEISLGYQHRGIEKMLQGGPDLHSLHFAETAAGDSTIASAWNYAAILEALGNTPPSSGTILLRRILLELERIANHVGDLGALAGDVAFLPTASYCGRIRGEYLNMTAEIAGNRFGRNVVIPRGMRTGLTPAKTQKIIAWIKRVKPELDKALELLFDEPSVLDRFENTGAVDSATASQIGLVGVAARACGLAVDSRIDFPAAHTPADADTPPICLASSGDVFARAKVRRDEINASHAWLLPMLESLAETGIADVNPTAPAPLQKQHLAVSITEAWRGELVQVAITNAEGCFARYKIVDPSFHNWFGLALALRGEQISNFPICNKSFSLSYCGHDL